MVNPNHITPYGEIPEDERELADDLVFNRREDALERFIEHFESKGPEEEAEAADPTAGMEPEEALHWHILRRKQGGRRGPDRRVGGEDRRRPDAQRRAAAGHEGGRRQVRRRRADPALRAAERRGDEARGRAARAVPRQASRATPRARSCSRPCSATCTTSASRWSTRSSPTTATRSSTSASRCRSRRSSTPPRSTTRPRSASRALLVSHLQADAAGDPGAARAGPRVPGADRRRRDQPQVRLRALYPGGQGVRRRSTSPGVFYCKDAFEGLAVMDQLVEPERARGARRGAPRRGRRAARRGRGRGGARHHRRLGALRRAHRRRRSPSRRSGACARSRSTSTRSTRTSTPTCCSSCTGAGAASRARSGGSCSTRTSARAWSACGPSSRLPAPARAARLLPVLLRGQRHRRARPRGPRDRARALHLPAPAQGRPHLPGRLLPPEGVRRARRRRRCRR